MRIAMFYHSLVSDWNHGNAHFLRGVVTELLARGHTVKVYEPKDSWSRINLIAEHGTTPLENFRRVYPKLTSTEYELASLDLESLLDAVDLVIVHEWNSPELVRSIGEHRARYGKYALLFHDTHHRMVTDPDSMERYDLDHYDGVLAYGNVLRDLYDSTGRVRSAWAWHEAADTRLFHPQPDVVPEGDVVWIGNWGDDERSAELREFLINPIQNLQLKARVYGVRYPETALKQLADAAIDYGGWLPNFEVPTAFARHRITVHVPRRPYVKALPGIPTIRPFEALACGIPLVCSPWDDAEGLFRPGVDYLQAKTGEQMAENIKSILADSALSRSLRENGLETIRKRHTCAHRVNELLEIVGRIKSSGSTEAHGREPQLCASSTAL